jgi:hypothetical protein
MPYEGNFIQEEESSAPSVYINGKAVFQHYNHIKEIQIGNNYFSATFLH